MLVRRRKRRRRRITKVCPLDHLAHLTVARRKRNQRPRSRRKVKRKSQR